jgi:hypothetical protein
MDTTMADAPVVRRSGRARTAVTSYADEQAQQDAMSAPPAKRRKAAGKTSQLQPKDELMGDVAIESEYDESKPLLNKNKRIKSEPNDDEYTDAAAFKTELAEDGDDFEPEPEPKKKERKKAAKKVKAIGKLDSEGVMRLDTTEPRPPGEKRPPRVYAVPPKQDASGKPSNLAAILAENFEQRFERKTSKIKRLSPGEPEVRLKP